MLDPERERIPVTKMWDALSVTFLNLQFQDIRHLLKWGSMHDRRTKFERLESP